MRKNNLKVKEMMTMKKRVYVMLLMTMMTVMAVAQTAQELLSEANAKYEAGQMADALELYTQAANKGLAEAQFLRPCGSNVLPVSAIPRQNTDWPPAI